LGTKPIALTLLKPLFIASELRLGGGGLVLQETQDLVPGKFCKAELPADSVRQLVQSLEIGLFDQFGP
jgi:hypothetical protein